MSDTYTHIVSLVPSLTELIVDLGLGSKLAGRTRFCVEPEGEIEEVPVVGGTKNPDLDAITDLDPDLVIANKEENRREDITYLADYTEVEVTDIQTVEDALITNYQLGEKLGAGDKASTLNKQISNLYEERPDERPLQTIYLIWKDPWMGVGYDTYIHDVMQNWNLTNATGYTARYPTITLEEMKNFNPELVLLSSEPFPFKQKHVDELESEFPEARVMTVDGKWFSWYGSHMKQAFDKLNTWRKAIS
jgi:ABC-type Fe3+-hydroxamate transport system substrate-binding protein